MLSSGELNVGELPRAIDKRMGKSGAAGNVEHSFQIGPARSELAQRACDDVLWHAVSTIGMSNAVDALYVSLGRDAQRDPAQRTAIIVKLQGGCTSHSLFQDADFRCCFRIPILIVPDQTPFVRDDGRAPVGGTC